MAATFSGVVRAEVAARNGAAFKDALDAHFVVATHFEILNDPPNKLNLIL